MGKGSQPKPPDPAKTVEAEARANRVSTFLPGGGGVRYGIDQGGAFVPGTAGEGQTAAMKVLETPFEQRTREILEPTTINVARSIGQGASNLQPLAAVPTAGEFGPAPSSKNIMQGVPEAASGFGWTMPIAQAMFERNASMVRPEVQQQTDRLLTNLQARGMPVGAEGFNETMGAHTREVQDGFNRLAMESLLAAGQEDSRRYAQQKDSRAVARGERIEDLSLAQTDRDRAIGEAFDFWGAQKGARDVTMNELASVLGGTFTPVASQPRSAPGVNPINVSGIIGNNYAMQAQAANARNQNTIGAVSGLANFGLGAGALYMMSSRKVKVDLGPIEDEWALDSLRRLDLRAWRYADDQIDDRTVHIGPYAEDWHEITGTSREDAIFATDPAALALAAVKGLMEVIERQAERIARLEAEAA